jgi:ABC-type transport system involved in multi-copper enzyme maturation permease subunit
MFTVSLRRFSRDTMAIALGLAAVGILALITGRSMNHQYHSSGLADCLALGNRDNCQDLMNEFNNRFNSMQILIVPLVLLPALLGAFIGAPMVARELETGTHRFLWTQGVTRQRWFTSTTTVALLLAAIAGTIYSLVAGVWLDDTNRITDDRFSQLYDFQGIIPIASAVFAVAVGIACGVLIRRTLPAMAATIGVFIAVRVSMALFVRPHLATPVTTSLPLAGLGPSDPLRGTGAWMLSNRLLDSTGHAIGDGDSINISSLAGRCPGIPNTPGRIPAPEIVDKCLADLGAHRVIKYQPGNRFWTFQMIESSILVGLALACIVVAHAALRRRAA